jgi:hypothetical protein
MRITPRGIGLNLAFKLYLVLIMVVGPSLLIYYIYNFRTIDALHEREVGDLVQLLSFRMEDWLKQTENSLFLRAEEEELARDLKTITERYPGVEGIVVFGLRATDLESRASDRVGVFPRATPQDVEAMLQGRTIWKAIQSGTVEMRLYSVPLFSTGPDGKSVGLGLLNLRVIPDKIGLGSELPKLRMNLVLGGAGLLLIVGVGVVFFFHIAVRRPIGELTASMEATESEQPRRARAAPDGRVRLARRHLQPDDAPPQEPASTRTASSSSRSAASTRS